MKKHIYLLLLPLGFLLTGCPLTTEYPIDAPSIKVNIGYLGKWQDATGGTNFSEDKIVYSVTKKTDFLYGIETSSYEYDEEGNLTEFKTIYEGHISKVAGVDFINIKDLSEGIEEYMIYKFELSGNNCILTEVSGCISQEFSSSAQLKAFLTKHINNELLFTDIQTFFRI